MKKFRILVHVKFKKQTHSGFYRIFGVTSLSEKEAINIVKNEIYIENGRAKIKFIDVNKVALIKLNELSNIRTNFKKIGIWYRSGQALY